ncbi:polysaccharide deacetylase family protein [Aliikangiella marina]|uniref:Polysaccharide deacetylase family protein n=1 Tax=Aliikangiella marina TaxID=1712262 RepID=A0A545T2F6_9GAMM|nr:polysaccharide deacetylase family protein [Aliikangiella marina]TQV71392.1 polysaccharide deacetylase family protein [Aliikangiella marina]
MNLLKAEKVNVSKIMGIKIILLILFSFIITCHMPVKAAVILQYHHIDLTTPRSTSTSPERFSQHMNYLAENQFNVVSLETFLSALTTQESLPPKSVVITFDDGYKSIYENAYPVLKEKGFPFTVFINTQPLADNLSQFMSWEEIIELTQNKGLIANHSVTHPHLIRRLQDESFSAWRERVTNEVLKSQKLIESKVIKTVRAFAYPYGEFNLEVKKILKGVGFWAFGQQSGAASMNVDPQAIPRFPFGGNYGAMNDFILKVNSLPMPVTRVELVDEKGNQLNDHQLPPDVDRPKMRLELSDDALNVSCFGPGGALEIQSSPKGNWFVLKQDLKPGRSRFNCTAPSSKKGQFYWFSQPFIKPNPDGSWYSE